MSSHLTHQQMLAYLDGELSRAETASAGEHLHSCWTCRIEMERLEGDIAVILDAHNESFAPAIPPPSNAWPSFDALLAKERPVSPQPLSMRVSNSLRTAFTPLRAVVAAGLLAVLFLFAYLKPHMTIVSAQEVLRSIQAADARRTFIPPGQVIRQRVHVRRKFRGQDQAQSGFVDAWKSSTAAIWQDPQDDSTVAALKEEYRTHSVPLNLPLSASSVEVWGKVAGGEPSVAKRGADLDLSFPGAADAVTDTSARVSLRVQPGTWQVKEMTLQFSDASFQVTEDSFTVMPTSDVPPVLLAQLEPGPSLTVTTATRPVADTARMGPIHPPEVNLDQAQLDVLTILHDLHADLGEPVIVAHSNHDVEVGVWQLPPARQNQIRAALQNEPGVSIRTMPPLQRSRLAPAGSPTPVPEATSARITVLSGEEDQRLLKFFVSAEKEQAFTTDVLSQSTAVLAHLYALRNLQAQFPPEKEEALSAPARAQLTAIVRDHAAAAAAALAKLQGQLAPLNGALQVSETPPGADTYGTRWQDASLDALATARGADHLLRNVFTTSETAVAPEAALPELQQKLGHLAAEMRDLQKM